MMFLEAEAEEEIREERAGVSDRSPIMSFAPREWRALVSERPIPGDC